MKETQKKALALFVSVLAMAGFIGMVEAGGDRGDQASMVADIAALDAEIAHRDAPPFVFKRFDKPGSIDLSKYRGKVIFLNFWASWCPPCREEMPSMEQLARKYKGRDLVMIAASQDDDQAQLRAFLKQVMPDGELVMEVGLDPGGQTAKLYGTQLLPETYIIDRDGRVVARFVNKYDWMRPEVDRFIERLLRQ